MTFRRIALAVLAPVAILVGLAGLYIREPPVSADSIERSPAYQNEALLARAWALPVARRYGPQGYLYQKNQSLCGPTSIADVLRSEGVAADPAVVLEHSPLGLNRDDWGIPLGVEMGESAFPSESGGAGCREAIPLICVSV